MYYSLGAFFFLLCFPVHACNARRLGFVAEKDHIDNHVDFLAKDKPKLHDQLKRPSITKEVETQKLQEDGVRGRRTLENLIGATMKQTLLNYLLKEKEAVEKAISSGYEISISSGVDLHGMAKILGLKRITKSTRSVLGISGDDNEEDHVDFKEKDNVDGNIDDVMDYSQPHRKPPIHNEKI